MHGAQADRFYKSLGSEKAATLRKGVVVLEGSPRETPSFSNSKQITCSMDGAQGALGELLTESGIRPRE